MIKKSWSNVEAAAETTSNNVVFDVPGGAYIVKIINVRDKVAASGNRYLEIVLDVAEGEYTDFAQKALDATGKDWSFKILRAGYEGKAEKQFRRLLEKIEQSNRSFNVKRWEARCNEEELIGLMFGVVFDEEVNTYNPSKPRIDVKPNYFKVYSIAEIDEKKYQMPKLVGDDVKEDIKRQRVDNSPNENSSDEIKIPF